MSYLRRFLFPRWGSLSSSPHCSLRLSLSKSTICERSGLVKIVPKQVCLNSHSYSLTVGRFLRRKIMQCLNLSGLKILKGSFLGFSGATVLIYHHGSVVYAADDHYSDIEEPSEFLKNDLYTFWSLARKFQLPLVLLITILLGWRHPVTLAVNVALLLFCTKPNPFSIYMFVEQLRQRDMRRDPSIQKMKYLYVRKIEVEDYKIMCVAKVELRKVKINVIGILGGWWIFQSSPTGR
ncbi:hypothetical protein AXF42_Ash004917 [Apostasia shenzhenica]|uniref:Uncharacterized protein n=1 Tax=Apostasia shenzhenica TaxID=1088818 RepID=A0A2I0B7X9_9ASPA|nr:hypothetical protein AXF42_Ash004917 [Apostasia shenzhenica]